MCGGGSSIYEPLSKSCLCLYFHSCDGGGGVVVVVVLGAIVGCGGGGVDGSCGGGWGCVVVVAVGVVAVVVTAFVRVAVVIVVEAL